MDRYRYSRNVYQTFPIMPHLRYGVGLHLADEFELCASLDEARTQLKAKVGWSVFLGLLERKFLKHTLPAEHNIYSAVKVPTIDH